MQLYIGNKNYSSWSLRAWLMARKAHPDFQEMLLKLDTPSFYQVLTGVSPTKRVPTLVDGDVTVWDSLAICEYLNDRYFKQRGWPADVAQRAKARAIAAEMHSGFTAVRSAMPMNIRAKRYVELNDTVRADISRIEQIWAEQMQQHAQPEQGAWLFGEWSIADAMFAPVVLRFVTYGVSLNADANRYLQHALSCPDLRQWITDALGETDIVEADEAGVDR